MEGVELGKNCISGRAMYEIIVRIHLKFRFYCLFYIGIQNIAPDNLKGGK